MDSSQDPFPPRDPQQINYAVNDAHRRLIDRSPRAAADGRYRITQRQAIIFACGVLATIGSGQIAEPFLAGSIGLNVTLALDKFLA